MSVLWIHNPLPERAKYLEVFVDLENLFRDDDGRRPWDRGTTIAQKVARLLEAAKGVGECVHMTLYVDLLAMKSSILKDIQRAVQVERASISLIHCEAHSGHDVVDHHIIRDMHRWHTIARADTALCLVSADSDYERVVRDIVTEGRTLLLGVPNLYTLPTLANTATGAFWADGNTPFYQAILSMCSGDVQQRKDAERFIKQVFKCPLHGIVRNALGLILQKGHKNPTFEDQERALVWARAIARHNSKTLEEWQVYMIAESLFEYRVLIPSEGGAVVWNPNHPAVLKHQPPAPTGSESAAPAKEAAAEE